MGFNSVHLSLLFIPESDQVFFAGDINTEASEL